MLVRHVLRGAAGLAESFTSFTAGRTPTTPYPLFFFVVCSPFVLVLCAPLRATRCPALVFFFMAWLHALHHVCLRDAVSVQFAGGIVADGASFRPRRELETCNMDLTALNDDKGEFSMGKALGMLGTYLLKTSPVCVRAHTHAHDALHALPATLAPHTMERLSLLPKQLRMPTLV